MTRDDQPKADTPLMKLLDSLEELEKKATKGEWRYEEEAIYSNGVAFEGTDDDGEFVCQSRNAFPSLLKAAREREEWERVARGYREESEKMRVFVEKCSKVLEPISGNALRREATEALFPLSHEQK